MFIVYAEMNGLEITTRPGPIAAGEFSNFRGNAKKKIQPGLYPFLISSSISPR